MNGSSRALSIRFALVTVVVAGLSVIPLSFGADMEHTSTPFMGPKANTGKVTHSVQNGRSILTLSDDFKVPDTPDPHWQLVDSNGKTYLLDRLAVKDGRTIRSIAIPQYVKDVVKVQIWCAWAEANLGEASFAAPVR